ncbi:hypothetical protein M514_21067 [Trichuris suis]|uniref:Uncharacterized protein n=1 Tax=Trichuris suis TaxID=68888 RepID=A0A085NB72_9BILA|nr:hypothetical protein M514_21067 [Trichuris suis]
MYAGSKQIRTYMAGLDSEMPNGRNHATHGRNLGADLVLERAARNPEGTEISNVKFQTIDDIPDKDGMTEAINFHVYKGFENLDFHNSVLEFDNLFMVLLTGLISLPSYD